MCIWREAPVFSGKSGSRRDLIFSGAGCKDFTLFPACAASRELASKLFRLPKNPHRTYFIDLLSFFFLHQFEQRVTFTRSPKRADLCCLCVSSPLLPVKQSSLSIYLFALPATSSNFSSEVKHARGLCYYLGIAVAKSLYA